MTAKSIVLLKGAEARESGTRGRTTTNDNENNKTTKRHSAVENNSTTIWVSNLNSRAISSNGKWCALYAQAGTDLNVTV